MLYQNIEWHNAAELLDGDGNAVVPLAARPTLAEWKVPPREFLEAGATGKWVSRVPDALRRKLNPLAAVNALQTTGVELRFNLRSERATFVLCCNDRPGIAEIYQGDFWVASHVVGTSPTEIRVQLPGNLAELSERAAAHRLPFDGRLTRVLLPWRPPARLISIEGDFEPPRPDQTPRRRLLMYGSSITQGSHSSSPSGTYAFRTAARAGFDLVNLGFGGGAHLEPEMATYIARRKDWDVATFETGINLGGIGPAAFAERVDSFIGTFARDCPDRWVFCLGVLTCGHDLRGDYLFAKYREIVRDRVRTAQLPKLVYVDGRSLLTSPGGLSADSVHPSPHGMDEIASNLSTVIAKHMIH